MKEDNDTLLYLVDTQKHTVRKKTILEYTIETYDKGFIDGLREFAYWLDGEQFVGTKGITLKEAIETLKSSNYYSPPKIKL